MKRRDLEAYWLFVAIASAQVGAFALIGDTRFTERGLVVFVGLMVWLGRRSRTAWWLFLIWNTVAFVATVGIVVASFGAWVGAGTAWGNVLTAAVGSAVMVAVLLSRPMRAWTTRAAV